MALYTTLLPTPLGTLTVQATEEYVTAVLFKEAEEKVELFSDRHPLLDRCCAQLEAYFEGRLTTFDLPLKQEGSAFQSKVWNGLMEIPFGHTCSYRELTRKFGDIKAIRAVAAANGRNRLSIIVPCHRVIGSDRSLTGYAGGLWRKKWLLEHEARFHRGLQTLF